MKDRLLAVLLGFGVRAACPQRTSCPRSGKNMLFAFSQKVVSVLILIFTGLALLLLLTVKTTAAQSGSLAVELEWPNEGETLYAGPSSLLYKIPIKGWITTSAFNPADIIVRLEVFEDSESIGSLETTLDADGRFQFFTTVNPKGSSEEFTIAFNDCGEQCHSPGDMDLQPGKLQLRVTAIDPDGDEATATRNITVDIAEPATVPVTVLLADDSEQVVEQVNVTASTWVYMWRARFGHGITDEEGVTAVQVEALSQSPTEYLFKIEPTVVDGILYEGVESVAVDLLPGAVTAPPITLRVMAYTGAISGRLTGMSDEVVDDLSVWAIRLPDGEGYQTPPSAQGIFTFPSVPIDHYLIAVGDDQTIENDIQSQPRSIDLFENRESEVDISLAMMVGNHLRGQVLDEANVALPFAWVTVEGKGQPFSAALDSGTVMLNGLPFGAYPIIVSAPGYYSRKQLVDLSFGSLSDVDLVLTQRPETRQLSWGTGTVILPPETQAVIENDTVILERGWLWGENDAAAPFIIQTPRAYITLTSGRFALIYLPGEQAWLYQWNGRAQMQPINSSEPIVLQSGQMINLLNDEGLHAVSFNPIVVAALNPNTTLPIPITWEPTLGARLRDQLAQAGINTAQIVTFITYFIVLLSLFLIPVTAVYWQWKRKKIIRQNAWRQH